LLLTQFEARITTAITITVATAIIEHSKCKFDWIITLLVTAAQSNWLISNFNYGNILEFSIGFRFLIE